MAADSVATLGPLLAPPPTGGAPSDTADRASALGTTATVAVVGVAAGTMRPPTLSLPTGCPGVAAVGGAPIPLDGLPGFAMGVERGGDIRGTVGAGVLAAAACPTCVGDATGALADDRHTAAAAVVGTTEATAVDTGSAGASTATKLTPPPSGFTISCVCFIGRFDADTWDRTQPPPRVHVHTAYNV